MGKTRNGKAALACTGAAFLFLVIAFTTPNWLQNDGVDREAKFKRIGNYPFFIKLISFYIIVI